MKLISFTVASAIPRYLRISLTKLGQDIDIVNYRTLLKIQVKNYPLVMDWNT